VESGDVEAREREESSFRVDAEKREESSFRADTEKAVDVFFKWTRAQFFMIEVSV